VPPPGDEQRAPVSVQVNGAERQLPARSTVIDLLAVLELTGARCAVEINRQIVPRSTHAEHVLQPGDRVEIVSFVGGG